MTVKLNHEAFINAKQLIESGKATHDSRDDWSEHAPTTDDENDFLDKHGWEEYSKWFLGVNDEMDADTKGHYEFPYGDFVRVHRCGIISAESRAGQHDHDTIRDALSTLLMHVDERDGG